MEETPVTERNKVKAKPQEGNRGKVKAPSWWKNATSYLYNFCDNTSIHGFKFFGESKRNIFERLYWLMIINIAIFGGGNLIYNAYAKWVTAPIIVTFAMTETPIWQIPFPAVTICPEINAHPSKFNYTDVYLKYWKNVNTTKKEDHYFKLFSLVCNDELEFINETETKYMSDKELYDFMDTFAEAGLQSCKWLEDDIDCKESLRYTSSSEGYCVTFNMLAFDDVYVDIGAIRDNDTLNNTKLKSWSLESGYPSNAALDAVPRRTLISGVNGGLQIDFEVNDDDLDYLNHLIYTVCGAGSKRCANKAKVEFLQREVSDRIQNKKGNISDECDCLPACTSIEFDSETSQTDWNWRKVYKLNPYKYNFDADYFKKKHKSRLLVYYKDLQFMTSERHELYGTIDFLANCGGLLGLCCGFSFTSVMEIVYYLTLRLISNIHKFGIKLWSGSEELIEKEADEDLYK